jgi:uncharacterized protein (TIGR00251 family)
VPKIFRRFPTAAIESKGDSEQTANMSMVSLELHPQGIVLPVRAQAGAKRQGLCGIHDGQLKVAVTQAAEKGKANDALVDVLADALGLRRSQLRLLTGKTTRTKRFLVTAIERDALARRIATALERAADAR